jgi:hypothetical protein
MRSYRFARRSFMAGVGGALGLKVLLRNMEAQAAGATPPPRFLLTHFPVGTLKYRFKPEGSGSTYVASPIVQPFETAGLRNDMTVFWGLSDNHLRCPGGGGHEAGTPFTTTCASAEGCRENGGEGDDGVAGGPSFDQIFLKHVPELTRPGTGYANAICDARVDSSETSTQCLSYSYTTRSIASAGGGNITENTPLLPKLSPNQLYGDLFANFMPGGSTPDNQAALIKALKMKKSVLDFIMAELAELKTLAPGSSRPMLDIHAEAVSKTEMALRQQIEGGAVNMGTPPPEPPQDLGGDDGNSPYQENVNTDDSPLHKSVIEAHASVLQGAFELDIIRVATFQFSPGTNHVSFKGMWPSDPNRIAMHHPVSHGGAFLQGVSNNDPASFSGADKDRYEFLCSVQTWYNQRLADMLTKFKTTTDIFGSNLLDYTVIPYVTEVGQANHSRSPKPAFLFGGTKLGLKHGTYQNFAGGNDTSSRPQVDLYLTAAQALLKTADPLTVLSDEKFVDSNQNGAPVDGLWAPPV